MSDKPTEYERLNHIIEAIDRIFRFSENMEIDDFYKNEMAQYAIIKNFEIIGEAAYQLPKELRLNYDFIE